MRKLQLDIYNYFSIAILENVGIEKPDQIQINKVESLLKKITKLIKEQPNGAKPPKGFLAEQ